MWPLNFWLLPAYTAASAPVAALFALMTKVGIYAVLRLWTLLLSAERRRHRRCSAPTRWSDGGLATLAFGALGLLASQRLDRLAGFSVIVSSGTLLAAIGFGDAGADGGGAVLPASSSTLAASALFLLVELVERARQVDAGAAWSTTTTDRLPLRRTPRPAARRQPRRRGAGADRPRDPGRAGLPRPRLHRSARCWSPGCRRCRASSRKFAMLTALLDPRGLGREPRTAGGAGRCSCC